MKYITTFFEKLLSKSHFLFSHELPKPMGRWNIEHCNKKINNKIDLANEDHCGPCGQYAITQIELKNKKNDTNL